MPRIRAISIVVPPLLLLAAWPAAAPARAQSSRATDSRLDSGVKGPTDAEMRERRDALIAHQHADDEALNFYERIERRIERSGGPAPRVLAERTYRVVPTGGGTMKILLRQNGTSVNASDYRRQLLAWRDVLEMMSTPGDSKAAVARAKYEKRERDRSEFVNAAQNAFLPKWLGRETLRGYSCDVFELDPNPTFHPSSMVQGALAHVTAKIWLDRESNQLVRGEAWVASNISFVAGIAGKVDRGSRVEMDQDAVAPGIWLPTHYEYDFTGRKFVFPFAEHETTEVSRYRRLGPPPAALAEVKNEIASGNHPVLNVIQDP
ncbi:MAG: hypothetical protein KGL02_12370 [Acidobacteriota bacterium]|nr:hypothetical protein [Acidobacteriota bacterium]MDE3170437.1 hypothetical protein [Acidobacteriota bacterium]